MTNFECSESEQEILDAKILKLVTPPDKNEYDKRKIPELSDKDRQKFHLTSPDEMDLVRKMVLKSVKNSTDRPFLSKEADLAAIGLSVISGPKGKEADAVKLIGEMESRFRTLSLSMDICTKCGVCVEACHTYLGTGDFNNAPVGRANLMRQIYRKYYSLSGKVFGRLAGSMEMTPEVTEDWYKYFYQCNECRRCAVYCPFGIDTCEITMIARQILTKLGKVPVFTSSVVKGMRKWGNNMGIPPPALADTCKFMEEELKEETGKDIVIPIDKEGAEVLYNPSSSEFFTNLDSLKGAAKLFYASGTSWTLSSRIIETANFGLFFDYNTMKEHNNRLINEANRLRVKRIIAGECGHGWRTWKMYTSQLTQPMAYRLTHIQDEILDCIRDQRVKLDPSANPFPVTLHDPCNMTRAAGYIEQPRQIVRAVCEDFREMWPNRERNFCCGAGSGILMDEVMDLRMKFSKVKAEQVRATGALTVIAPCAICKAQLPNTMAYWQTGATVHGLIDMVGYALIL